MLVYQRVVGGLYQPIGDFFTIHEGNPAPNLASGFLPVNGGSCLELGISIFPKWGAEEH